MLRVTVERYEDLSEEEQREVPNNGYGGKEYATYVRIKDGEHTIELLSDAMEPEDATFNRDLSDVPAVILRAYRIGVRDGKRIGN